MDKKAPAGNPSRPNPLPGCPMAAAFAAIGGKWKLTLLYWLVERVETGPVPAPVLYRLTPYGETVLPVVEGVRVWGEAHLVRTHGDAAPTAAMSCATTIA
ncbi:winged helix-turn-helix transcriptional regulator [Lentzea sp. HUAS TT2]|uniref:winged helix-turn-helix transcriptional regulator n=1 Tax=Lentzea sp. HUAS TT2 TaxID=3447454 RepID=UPI003F7063A6